MSNAMSLGTVAQVDHNKAKIRLGVSKGPEDIVIEIDHRWARSLAIQLLQLADEAERQRAHNLKRVVEAGRSGDTDTAAWMAEANGFTDEEINAECDRLDRLANKEEK